MKAQSDAYVRRIERLYYSARDKRQAIADARDWLLDCFDDPDDRETIALSGHFQIVQSMNVFYDGGWRGFLRDSDNVRVERG